VITSGILSHIDHDLHVHTYLSDCCKDKEHHRPGAILSLAENMGVRTIGFTDHLWANPDIPASEWYGPQNRTQISRLREDLASVSSTVRVLVGCESEIVAPGKYGITREFAETLDFVLLPGGHFHMGKFVEQPKSDSPRDIGRHVLKFFVSAASSGLADAIAHPLKPIGYVEKFDQAIAALSDAELTDAFGVAADRNVAVEVTTGFLPSQHQEPFSIETPIRFLSLAKEAGCKFTFGTDAHNPERQRRLPELMQFVTAIGITTDDLSPLVAPG